MRNGESYRYIALSSDRKGFVVESWSGVGLGSGDRGRFGKGKRYLVCGVVLSVVDEIEKNQKIKKARCIGVEKKPCEGMPPVSQHKKALWNRQKEENFTGGGAYPFWTSVFRAAEYWYIETRFRGNSGIPVVKEKS